MTKIVAIFYALCVVAGICWAFYELILKKKDNC